MTSDEKDEPDMNPSAASSAGAAEQANDQAGNTADPAAAPRTPTRQESLRPLELIGGAAILALFVGLVVIFATREPILALIFFGIAFIITLVVLAMFTLGRGPGESERHDLEEQDEAADHAAGTARAGDGQTAGHGDGAPSGDTAPDHRDPGADTRDTH
jgi:hypothetical protein